MAKSYKNAVTKKKKKTTGDEFPLYDDLGNIIGMINAQGEYIETPTYSSVLNRNQAYQSLNELAPYLYTQRQSPSPMRMPQQQSQAPSMPANIGGGGPMNQGLPPPSQPRTPNSTADWYAQHGSLYGPAQPNYVPVPQGMQMGPTQIPAQTYDFDTMTVRQANDLLFGPQGYYTRRGQPTTGALANQRAASPTMANAPARLGGGGASQPQAMKQAKNVSGYMNSLSDVEAMMPQNRGATATPPPKPVAKPTFTQTVGKGVQGGVKTIQNFINSLLPKRKK